jgi:hypothetical protein
MFLSPVLLVVVIVAVLAGIAYESRVTSAVASILVAVAMATTRIAIASRAL